LKRSFTHNLIRPVEIFTKGFCVLANTPKRS
jgi:hypothetical protein